MFCFALRRHWPVATQAPAFFRIPISNLTRSATVILFSVFHRYLHLTKNEVFGKCTKLWHFDATSWRISQRACAFVISNYKYREQNCTFRIDSVSSRPSSSGRPTHTAKYKEELNVPAIYSKALAAGKSWCKSEPRHLHKPCVRIASSSALHLLYSDNRPQLVSGGRCQENASCGSVYTVLYSSKQASLAENGVFFAGKKFLAGSCCQSGKDVALGASYDSRREKWLWNRKFWI